MSTVNTGQVCLYGHPRQADVQEDQVGEEGNRAVLSRRQQRRRGEAAEQSKHRDEQRFPPEREQHGDRRHRREQHESHQRGNQVPQRVRCEKGREEDGDGRGVERVGGAGYRRAALSSQTTSRAMATAMPIRTRTGGCSHPCCAEYFRKKTAAITMAMPEIAGNSLAPARLSQSKDGAGGSARTAAPVEPAAPVRAEAAAEPVAAEQGAAGRADAG